MVGKNIRKSMYDSRIGNGNITSSSINMKQIYQWRSGVRLWNLKAHLQWCTYSMKAKPHKASPSRIINWGLRVKIPKPMLKISFKSPQLVYVMLLFFMRKVVLFCHRQLLLCANLPYLPRIFAIMGQSICLGMLGTTWL